MSASREPWSFPSFRLMLFGRAFSSAGSFMQMVAATWYAYKLTDSAASVGVLAVLTLGPSIVCSPAGGVLLDRFDARRLGIVLSLLSAIPIAAMSAMAYAGHLSLGWMYVLIFASVIPGSLNFPVLSLVAPATVPVECRHSAIALLSLSGGIGQILGGPLGGFVVNKAGVWLAFGLNAATYVIIAAVLAVARLDSDTAPSGSAGPQVAPRLRDGVTVLREMPFLRLTVIGVAAFYILAGPVEHLMPVIAGPSASAGTVGLLLGAIGVGSMVANPVIGRQQTGSERNQHMMQLGLLSAAAGMVIFALASHAGIVGSLLAATLVGFGIELVWVGGLSTATVAVPPEMRGRTMGIFIVLVNGGSALGAYALGALHDWLGTTWTLLGAAAVLLIVDGYLISRPAAPKAT